MQHARMNCHHTPQVQAMSRARAQAGDTPRQARAKVRWRGVAAALCLSAWIALGAGIVLEAGAGTMVVLASIAAVTTEGTIWVAAAVLGVRALQGRRRWLGALRRRFS